MRTFFHAFLLTSSDQIAGHKNNVKDEQKGTSRGYGDDNYLRRLAPGKQWIG
jgi:hypothetical protein